MDFCFVQKNFSWLRFQMMLIHPFKKVDLEWIFQAFSIHSWLHQTSYKQSSCELLPEGKGQSTLGTKNMLEFFFTSNIIRVLEMILTAVLYICIWNLIYFKFFSETQKLYSWKLSKVGGQWPTSNYIRSSVSMFCIFWWKGIFFFVF